jgi:hypothetical protein
VTRSIRALLAAGAALGLASLSALGCGPSVQSIYEGNVRFEHCYRLDLELDVATSHRQACWTTWLERYTYGQSRDRLEYARRRVRAFAAGDTNPPVLKIGGADTEQESRQFYLVVPAPTSVHASPPPIATRVNLPGESPTGDAATSAKSTAKPTPGEDCSAACRGAFSSCSDVCEADPKSPACKSCDPDYKKCMQRCFE